MEHVKCGRPGENVPSISLRAKIDLSPKKGSERHVAIIALTADLMIN